jgi:hypothetical protein
MVFYARVHSGGYTSLSNVSNTGHVFPRESVNKQPSDYNSDQNADQQSKKFDWYWYHGINIDHDVLLGEFEKNNKVADEEDFLKFFSKDTPLHNKLYGTPGDQKDDLVVKKKGNFWDEYEGENEEKNLKNEENEENEKNEKNEENDLFEPTEDDVEKEQFRKRRGELYSSKRTIRTDDVQVYGVGESHARSQVFKKFGKNKNVEYKNQFDEQQNSENLDKNDELKIDSFFGSNNKLESFAIGETFFYMYLAFLDDDINAENDHLYQFAKKNNKTARKDNFVDYYNRTYTFNLDDWIFTTEGQPLPVWREF